jgi:hypothetical protein
MIKILNINKNLSTSLLYLSLILTLEKRKTRSYSSFKDNNSTRRSRVELLSPSLYGEGDNNSIKSLDP